MPALLGPDETAGKRIRQMSVAPQKERGLDQITQTKIKEELATRCQFPRPKDHKEPIIG